MAESHEKKVTDKDDIIVDNKAITKMLAIEIWDEIKERVLKGHLAIKFNVYKSTTDNEFYEDGELDNFISIRQDNISKYINNNMLKDSGLEVDYINFVCEKYKSPFNLITLREI